MGKGTGQRQAAERNVHRRSAVKARDRWFPPVLGSMSVVPAPELDQTEASPRRHYPIRVLIADDDDMVRQTLLEAIEQTDGIVVIGTREGRGRSDPDRVDAPPGCRTPRRPDARRGRPTRRA